MGGEPRFVGLDISLTQTGYAVWDPTKDKGSDFDCGLVCSSPGNATDTERFDLILMELMEKIKPNGYTDLFVIENYAYTAKGHLSRKAELTGIIKQELYAHRGVGARNILVAAPTTLKKYATGQGKGSKDVVIKHVYQKWCFDTDISDIADAYVLARMGREFHKYRTFPEYKAEFRYRHEVAMALFKQNGRSFKSRFEENAQ